MNSIEKNKFLGMLYDMLIDEGIIKYEDKSKDLKEKKERLEKYLDKLERVQGKSQDNDRYLNMIKQLYYDRYIIKESDIPDKYFESLQQQYLEQGYGYINLVSPQTEKDKNLRREHIQTVIREQKDSFDNWLNYFLSEDSSYLEMWAKVWAFQGMLHIGNINKNKDGYDRRSKTSVNPFVSFDSEILGKCVELVKETFDKKELTDEEVKKLVSSGSFTKIYGKLLANKKQIKAETTEGIWIKYNKETEDGIEEKLKSGQEPEYIKLYNSLQGYNTGWCTAGSRDTAKDQILGGDFYVYYSKDKEGLFTIPRLAIRMEDFSIGEIRGIADNQNIESNMEKILEEKLKEFPDRDKYKKKVSDMKYLTIIYNKRLRREKLTKCDLIFLYEIYSEIEGFGFKKDPRVKRLIKNRNKRKNLSYALDCTEEEIGLTKEDFYSGRKLKYYEGDLHFDILKNAQDLMLPEIFKGDLYLTKLTSAEGLVLPRIFNGSLCLWGLRSAEKLVLPEQFNGHLFLFGLRNAEGLVLPEQFNGQLCLNGLRNTEGLVLPERLNGSLELNGLTSAEGLVLPKIMSSSLNLGGLKSAEGLVLPEIINYYLDLSGLTSAEGLVLPKIVGELNLNGLKSAKGLMLPSTLKSSLHLCGLKSAEGLVLPKKINGSLNLGGLTSAEGLVLPETVRSLILDSLTSAEGLVLPQVMNGLLSLRCLRNAEGLVLPEAVGSLRLDSLTSLVGITLPKKVDKHIVVYDNYYTLKQVIEMQRQEREKIKNNSKKLERVRQEGFISNTIIIFNIILFGVLCYILTLLFIK